MSPLSMVTRFTLTADRPLCPLILPHFKNLFHDIPSRLTMTRKLVPLLGSNSSLHSEMTRGCIVPAEVADGSVLVLVGIGFAG